MTQLSVFDFPLFRLALSLQTSAIMSQPVKDVDAIAATIVRAVERPDSRRTSPRASLTAEVDLSSDTNFFNGFSTDIAAGGLFIATLTILPVGTCVSVKFSLPNGTQIRANGEVRWVRVFDERSPQMLPGIGIQFVDLPETEKLAIEAFVAQREPMFFPD